MSDADIDPYELLEITTSATEQDIRTAYRKKSLKIHPDRNPNNPDAARKFHELNQVYELLLDPLRRLALDAKQRVKLAKAERFKDYDDKRKRMVEELEESERAFKKSRAEKQKEEIARWQETEKIKDEGRRMREEREKASKEVQLQKETQVDEPTLGSNDTTIRVKYTISDHKTLTTQKALSDLFSQFGQVDTEHIALLLKPQKKNPTKAPKYGSALISFKKVGDAFAAVCATRREGCGLKGIDVGWVGGKEPQIIGWLKRNGMIGTPIPQTSGKAVESPSDDSKTPFSSFPASFPDNVTSLPNAPPSTVVDYESLTLMRMRQAERERLEREILEQEASS